MTRQGNKRPGFCAGGEIYYEDIGRGTPIVFISGLGGVGSFWEYQVEAFSDRYRVIVHDHRGTGKSARSAIRYSVPQMARDALAVMDATQISDAFIIGHSTGGAIAQYIAALHPTRAKALVLSSTWSWADDYFRVLFNVRKEILATSGFGAYELLGKLLCYPPEFLAANSHLLERPDKASPKDIDIVLGRIEALLDFDSRSFIGNVQVPVMVIGADDDPVTPPHLADNLAKLLPRVRRTRLRTGGHFCPRTVPAAYNAALSEFFESVQQSATPKEMVK